VHPLVPLQALSRVKDRQQICVAVSVVENPGAIERGPAMVCNAIVQQGATRVSCSFWLEQAQELAEQAAGACLMNLSGSDQQTQGRELMGNWQLAWHNYPAVFAGSGHSAVLGPQCVRAWFRRLIL